MHQNPYEQNQGNQPTYYEQNGDYYDDNQYDDSQYDDGQYSENAPYVTGGYNNQQSYNHYDGYDDYEEEDVSIGKEGKMRVAAGVMDFALVVLGLVAILLCFALLVSLVNWVVGDINRSFFVLQRKI